MFEGYQGTDQSEVEKILEKYMSYSIVVAVYDQRFPHCALFDQFLSDFFVVDNLTFVLFDPNSGIKFTTNLNDISPYEYFEGDIMHKYVYDCIFKRKIWHFNFV